MEWCIELVSDPGHVIFDGYMGSGTTGVACIQTGRKFIGVEISEEYFKIACERLRHAWAVKQDDDRQQPMFPREPGQTQERIFNK